MTFHNVTQEVLAAVARANVRNGIVVVYSQHTTCSVMLQEESHDATYHGTKYLLQDLVNVLEKIIPRCQHEGQYLHPGRAHIEHAVENLSEEAAWSLNTDAHLRSCLIGRSESIPIVEGKLELGRVRPGLFRRFRHGPRTAASRAHSSRGGMSMDRALPCRGPLFELG